MARCISTGFQGSVSRFMVALLVAFAGAVLLPVIASAQQGGVPALVPDQSGGGDVTETTEVAQVNGEPIFFGEVMSLIQRLPPQLLQRVPPQELYRSLLASAIDRKLAAQAAAKSDVGEDPVVKQRLRVAREEVLRQAFLDKRAEELITPEAVRAAYDEMVAEGGNSEVRARHILVKTEEEGVAIIKELDGGADFGELAKERSTGPSGKQGGDLGYFTADRMVPEFATAAFALDAGAYTEAPVKTQFGWHVILVEDKRETPVPSFQESAQEITSGLRDEALGAIVSDLRDKAEIEAYSPDGSPLSVDELPRQGR